MARVTPVFYVYAHRRNDTGEIFYIGKGNTNRAWARNRRSSYWKNIVNLYGYYIELLHEDLDEEMSLTLEVMEINNKRSLGVNLCNFTNGGDGSTGFKFSESQREGLKTVNNPKRTGHTGFKHSKEAKLKMGKSLTGKNSGKFHHMFGKKHSDEIKNRMSIGRIGKSSGNANYFYNPTIYEFYNLVFGSVKTTQYEMKKYFPELIKQGISSLCCGSKSSYKGWSVIG